MCLIFFIYKKGKSAFYETVCIFYMSYIQKCKANETIQEAACQLDPLERANSLEVVRLQRDKP